MADMCQACGSRLHGTGACPVVAEQTMREAGMRSTPDADELVRWAEMYGHPEEWAKKAQQAHADNEKLRETLLHLDDFLARYDADLSPQGSSEVSRLRLSIDRALGHVLIRMNVAIPMIPCHQCGRATVRRDGLGRAYCIGCEERDRGQVAWLWPENQERIKP